MNSTFPNRRFKTKNWIASAPILGAEAFADRKFNGSCVFMIFCGSLFLRIDSFYKTQKLYRRISECKIFSDGDRTVVFEVEKTVFKNIFKIP